MTRALVLSLALATGCGAGQAYVAADTARSAACIAAEEAVEEEFDREHLTYDEARDRIDCIRLVCDRMAEELDQHLDAEEE